MKAILLFLFLIGISNGLKSQFISSGTGEKYSLEEIALISPTTVIRESSTKYHILQNITVLKEDSLVINTDNAEILLDGGKLVTINGYFEAKSNDILFSSYDPSQPCMGFMLSDTSKILLENAKFQYGGGIKCNTDNIMVDHCEFYKNVGGITTKAAFEMDLKVTETNQGRKPTIRNSKFIENKNSAFVINRKGVGQYLQFISNYLYKNGGIASAQLVINSNDSWSRKNVDNDTIRISKNSVIGDRNVIGMIGGVNIIARNSNYIFSENNVRDNSYGVSIVQEFHNGWNESKSIFNYVKGNIIEYNNTNVESDLSSGYGIICDGGNATGIPRNITVFSRNKIRYNYTGLYYYTNIGTVYLGSSEEVIDIGQNVFLNNIRNGKETALKVGYKTSLLSAKFNCWKEGAQMTDAMVFSLIEQTYDPEPPEILLPRVKPYSCDFLNSDEIKDSKFVLSISPNPIKDIIYVDSPIESNASFLDFSGKSVYKVKLSKGRNLIKPNLKTGVYFLQAEGIKEVKKIIVN